MNNIKKDFPWFKNNPKYIYFDSAATTIKPKCVISEEASYYEKLATSPHNIDSAFSFSVLKYSTEARKTIATLFNTDYQNVVFTSGATESLNLIANGLKHILKKNDEIILNDLEHASNLLPWIDLSVQGICKVKYFANNKIPVEKDFINAVNSKTKILTFSPASNIVGNFLDYKKITIEAKKKNPNLIVVIDATQYLAHQKIDVSCGVDFVVCSGHKILGPQGIGALYMNPKWINIIKPLRLGGGMNEIINRDGYTCFQTHEKFEGGTGNTAGILAWAAAIRYLDSLGWNKTFEHDKKLKKYLVDKLSKIKNITIFNKDSVLPIIIFSYKNVHAQDFASWLGTKKIIVRSGLSCAKLSRFIYKNDAYVRCSLYIYNDFADIDRFIEIVKSFKKGDEIDSLLG